ncbi:MAG: CocE/NonD family hydrolase [Chloroflexia bacterium]|nr:CocE/NonD family hydrolase [Chloroflexia bacterium]
MDIVVHKDIVVTMRDGVPLATDLYRPVAAASYPVLLIRTPYNKDLMAVLLLLAPDPLRLAQAGYAVLVQDCRGCFHSGGELNLFAQEADDSADTLAWAAQQPWSNGLAGMLGGSYLGAVQWLTAVEAPPSLQAIAPYLTSAQFYTPWIYQGGAFQLGFCLFWALGYFALPELQRRLAHRTATLAEVSVAMHALGSLTTLYQRTPLLDHDELGPALPLYQTWLNHPTDDAYWQALDPEAHFDKVTLPALIIGGWYDPFLAGTLASYVRMRQDGGSEEARRPMLVIGPWSHGVWTGIFAERDFGLLASTDALDLTGLHLRWFDYWLKGEASGVADDPPVKIFVMGVNHWREEEDWPLPATHYTPYYLHSHGHANTLHGDGWLALEPPGAEPPDVYRYDPRDPVPTCGGATLLPGALTGVNAGPRDQRALEARPDVLVYTTPPLTAPLEVIGPIRLVLYASSSAYDTDFTGKIVDVFPDGRAHIVTDGILRARYRHSTQHPELLEPGAIDVFELDLVATAIVFLPGHRVRLEVSSSNFPRFDRNTNTGGVIATEAETAFAVATNQIFHDAAHPSHLLLPVIPSVAAPDGADSTVVRL